MVTSFEISEAGTVAELPPAVPIPSRLEFETLLSNISARLIAVSSDRIGESIEAALEAIRRFFNVDRCGILAVSDSRDSWNLTYAAYNEGLPHVSGEVNMALLYPRVT